MKITKIERQEKDEKRFSVFIDDKFAFGLSGVDLLYYKLEVGQELSQEKYNYIIDETIFSKARDKAVKFLSYRARSRKEVYEKLAKEDYPEEIIERVIELMEKYGYIDDYKFSICYIRDKIKINGFGSIRIAHELKEKGVKGDIINETLAQLNLDESDTALAMLTKRYKNRGIVDIKEKNKAYEFLLRKGFSYEIINKALSTFMAEQKH